MAPHSFQDLSIDDDSNHVGKEIASKPARTFEMEGFRSLVPVAAQQGTTYLNASLQPPLNNAVRAAIESYMDEAQTLPNPKMKWIERAEGVRATLGQYLNVEAETLAYTRDTTEALNLFQRSLTLEAGDNVIVLDVEHPNHTYGWLGLAAEKGVEVRQVSTAGMELFADASSFEPLVDDRTRAIGISSIMFHSGQKNDIKGICDAFRSRGVHVLVDMTQEVGVAKIDLRDLGVSAVAFSCHKALGCPAGLGVLYIDPEVLQTLKPTPPIIGAGAIANLSSDLIVDASTEVMYHSTTRRYEHLNISMISIHALRASLDFHLNKAGLDRIERHLRGLGRALRAEVEPLGVKIVGPEEERKRSPHLYVLGLLSPRWEAQLEKYGIVASYYRLGIRISFGFYNNLDDVKVLGDAIREGVAAGIPLN